VPKPILTATLLLCGIHPARTAEPRQYKPISLLESIDNQRLLTIDSDRSNREATDEELKFTKRFNNLVRALRAFSNSYNVGHVINAKQAKAVRKALRDLEKSEWFHSSAAE
jgi:hypothetical protein